MPPHATRKHKSIPSQCLYCNQEFAARLGKLPSETARFCSRACASQARKTSVSRTCETCGTEFITKASQVQAGNGKYCSSECYHSATLTPEATSARFWEKVNTSNATGCWLWIGTVSRGGYGEFWLNGVSVGAHRFSYELAHGPVPDGLVVDHFKCDNPPCVRPDHLRAVTSKQNTLRSKIAPAARNSRKTHCVHGHPLSGPNLRIKKSVTRPFQRACRACEADQRKRYAAKKVAPLAAA